MARQVIIPSFRYSEIKTRQDGSIRTNQETLKEELINIIDSYPDQDGDCIVICVREKMRNDYRYGIASIPSDGDIVGVSIPEFKQLSEVVITNKMSKFKTILRIINNMTFA